MKQKTTHKILSLLLAVVLLFSLVPAVFAEGGGHITATKQTATEITQGQQYTLDLSQVFADSEGHTLSYAVTNDEGNQSTVNLKDGVYYFTSPVTGTYHPTITAQCESGSDSLTLDITVKAGEVTDVKQYDYNETDANQVTVYVTISSDGVPILGKDKDETVLSHLKVTVPYFDLARYDLQDFYRYATENGSGGYTGDTVIKRPTAMHLFIYMLERFYLGLPEDQWGTGASKSDLFGDSRNNEIANMFGEPAYEGKLSPLYYTGSATSTYMQNFWGHDENLMYYRNHRYPLMSPGWGATADYILLSDGDTVDLAMFTDWGFYHHGAFCCTGAADSTEPVETLTVTQGETLRFTGLKYGTQSVADGGVDSFIGVNENDDISYQCFDQNWEKTKNQPIAVFDKGTGNYEMDTTGLAPGTYHLVGLDPNYGTADACDAPASCDVIVKESGHVDANDDGICDFCGEKFNRAPRLCEGVTDVEAKVVVGEAYLLRDLQAGKIFVDPDGDPLYVVAPGVTGESSTNYFYQRSTDGGQTWGAEQSFAGSLFGATTIAITEKDPGTYHYRFYAKDGKGGNSADNGAYWNLKLTVDEAESLEFETTFHVGKDQNYDTNGNKNAAIKVYPSLGVDQTTGYAIADYDHPVTFLDSDFAAAEDAANGYMSADDKYNQFYAKVKGGWYVVEGYGWNSDTNAYDIDLGGMQVKIPADSNVDGAASGGSNLYFSVVSVYSTSKKADDTYFGTADYTVKLVCPLMQCTAKPGTPYVSGNYTYYPHMAYLSGNACLYNYYVYPVDTDQYFFNQGINKAIAATNNVTKLSLAINAAQSLTITVPEAAKFGLYFQANNFNTSEQVPASDWTSNGDGTKTALYKVSKSNSNYTWRMSDTTGTYVTKAGWLPQIKENTAMTFNFDGASTAKNSHDFSQLGTTTINRDEADLQVFVSPSGAKALGGGTERIRAYRMWQLINSDTANIMIEPDYTWTKLSGPADISFVDDSAVVTGTQIDSGNGHHNWADISANGGTSIFAVHYDAIDLDTSNNPTHTGFYPATNPDRVAFVVVADELGSATANVPFNGDFEANSRLDDWDYIYDTWYYMKDEENPALTFTATGAAKVEYAFGLTDGATMESTVSDFTAIQAENGSYSVPLAALNNAANNFGGTVIIRMTDADGKYSYQLVKTAGISVTVNNKTLPGEPAMPGNTVELSFDGLYRSINKISGIFNPTTFYLRYTADGKEINGQLGQYQQMDKSTIAITIPEDIAFEENADQTTYTITNGYVFGSMYSAANPFGAMYYMTDTGVGTNFNAVTVSFAFQNLCDIAIPVIKMPTTAVTLQVEGPETYTATIKSEGGNIQTAENGIYTLNYGTYSYSIEAEGFIKEVGKFTVGMADNGEKTVTVTMRKVDAATWDGETATDVTPNDDGIYEIRTGAELAWFAQQVNAGAGASYNAILMNDISLNWNDWTPIGISSAKAFKGSFDGNGHVIGELYINATAANQGLFGYINAATIKNLGVTGSVTSTGNGVGGIVGWGAGTIVIENCFNAADINGKQGVGGIVGSPAAATGKINNCYNTGSITAAKYGGGISGCGSTVSLCAVATNCFNMGTVNCAASGGGINPGAAAKGVNSYYLNTCYATGTSAKAGTPKTASEMASADFATLLGDAFTYVDGSDYPVLTWQIPAAPAVTYGDVTGDGMVDSQDATLVYAFANGKQIPDATQMIAADVNGDGAVDSQDATLVYAFANGKLLAFPCATKN